MAEDFDESAAAPVGEVIAQLRAELGLSTDDAPAAGSDDKSKLKADDADDTPTIPVADKKETGVKDDVGDDDKETPPDDKDKTPDDPSPELIKLLEKSGFDPDRFATLAENLQATNTRLHDKLEALEEKLEKLGSDELDPAIAELNSELEAVDGDIKTNIQRQNVLVKKGEVLRAEISEIKGQIKATEDETRKAQLEAKIETRQETLDRHADKWDDIARENKRLQRQMQKIEASRKDVEEEIKSRREEISSARKELSDWQTTQYNNFNSALKALPKLYKMTPAEAAHMDSMIRAEAQAELRKDPKGKAIDLVKYVAQRSRVHAQMMKVESTFTKTAKDKAEVTPATRERVQVLPRKQPAQLPAARSSKGGRISDADAAKSAEEARAFAAKHLGG